MEKVAVVTVAALAFAASSASAGYAEYVSEWGSTGYGSGQFHYPGGVAVAANGDVYVADTLNDRIQYFTATGSFRHEWGASGSGPGQFKYPCNVALNAAGNRVYVGDTLNDRIQYFKQTNPSVSPASLGRTRALFK